MLNEDLCSLQLRTAYFNSIRNHVYLVTFADLLSKAVGLISLAFTDLWYVFDLLENVTISYLTLLHNILF